MPDLEVDLVDQFICPPCVEKNTHLSLHTTYKRRCLFGLKHPTPSSPNACHKPARGILSKYCSEECGIRFMQMRIDAWADKGGDKRKLWENVKDAEKREGVVIRADSKKHKAEPIKTELDESRPPKSKGPVTPPEPKILKPTKTKKDREVERLQKQLDRMMQQREEMKKEMDVIVWRERLTALASERAEKVEECGWDQRLCFGDEEWEEFGEGVLESYEDGGDFMTGNLDGDEGMQVDGATAQHGEWWCRGKKKCERHVG
ncbi:hypothetical protein JAAARDRAFT_120782 [Jaapia argillacea MUCL 33604]|uniref:Uncharacterized protein n=1 Tax=Jaapia argillacea MUCL 33604 TaxID=933084 RepID=A0A067QJL4_9AGAM|nr:hypothetical protein JAAARDRAFT_120782 [Jaapia argillacea MUCL 33604]